MEPEYFDPMIISGMDDLDTDNTPDGDDEMSEWHPMSELPINIKIMTPRLVTHVLSGHKVVSLAIYVNKDNSQCWLDVSDGEVIFPIAWMPLPEPCQGEVND